MTLETLRGNVRSLHASYGFEQKIKEVLELLIKNCQDLQDEVHELHAELDSLKAGKA